MIWSPSDDARLRAMWADGYSLAMIGVDIKRTKGSVGKRAERLKLPDRVVTKAMPGARLPRLARGVSSTLPRARSIAPKGITFRDGPSKPPTFFAVPVAPDSVPVPLWERTGCAFPVERTTQHLFCDMPVTEPGCYCTFHHQRMYRVAW